MNLCICKITELNIIYLNVYYILFMFIYYGYIRILFVISLFYGIWKIYDVKKFIKRNIYYVFSV